MSTFDLTLRYDPEKPQIWNFEILDVVDDGATSYEISFAGVPFSVEQATCLVLDVCLRGQSIADVDIYLTVPLELWPEDFTIRSKFLSPRGLTVKLLNPYAGDTPMQLHIHAK